MARQNPFEIRTFFNLKGEGSPPLEVQLIRGKTVESVHRVHVCVKDASGKLHRSWGNPSLQVFPRSSIKVLQALPLLSGVNHRMGSLSKEELALLCSSHHGEAIHVRAVRDWLERIGCKEENLECGVHAPYHGESAAALIRLEQKPCAIHNNCSGKHTGMLMGCQEYGFSLAGYSNYDHPYQEEIRSVLGVFFDLKMRDQPWGIDGCGVPNYTVPLERLALGMARLANPRGLGTNIENALAAIQEGIRERPMYFGGTESFCTKIALSSQGRVLAKVGAEGVYGAWIEEAGFGVALKCEDGAGRAAKVALTSVLLHLGFDFPSLHDDLLIRRWSGEVVGQFHCM